MKSGWYFLVFAIFANVSFAMDFTCIKTIEDNALYTHCENKIANYPEPIHYFIPKNLNEAETVIVNIHFQGITLMDLLRLKTLETYSLIQKKMPSSLHQFPKVIVKPLIVFLH